MAEEQIVTNIVAKADLSSLVAEVHRATASLQQLQRELLTSNKSIAAAGKVANNLFRDTLVSSGMYSSHFVNLNSDVDKFGKNLDAGRLKLKDYFTTFRQHAKTSTGLIRELAREQVMLQNAILQPLGRNAQGLMQFNALVPRGLDEIRSKTQLAKMEMQVMNKALLEGSTALVNWGKNTQWAGRQLTVGLTVPLTMFGTSAARAFRQADQELVRLQKVYGGLQATSATELAKVRKDVVETARTLASSYGATFQETLGLAADIAATGKQGNELLGSIKETTRLAILGEVDRQDAMKATLAIQTAFKENTTELADSINFLNAVENQTSTTLDDLVTAIPKAGPVIKGLGGSVKDLALYLTAMREGGISATEGANALKSGLASLINPTKAAQDKFKSFGIDILGIVNQNAGDVTGTLLTLQKQLDKLNPLQKQQAIEQLFGKFQFARMNALFENLGKQGSQTLQVLDLMKASTQELANVASRELNIATQSASGRYKRALETLKADLASSGERFLDVGTKLINVFDRVLRFFEKLPEPVKKVMTYLGGFAAIVGPVVMLTGVLANFFGYITKGIVSLRSFFMGQKGWKLLTPEIIAAEKATQLVEKGFYSDAEAATVLHSALTKLITDYDTLKRAMVAGTIPVNPTVSTVGGSTVMAGGLRREVDPTNIYAGAANSRAIAHINPRDVNAPATIMGGVPAAIPVNQKILANPQIYMHERLPDVPGLTTVNGVSTGIVAGEAARFHALMATLGMQTEAEVAALKKTISLGGTVSHDLLNTFDDILPLTTKIADNAATASAGIVAELRAGKISIEAARQQILSLNAQIEQQLMAETAAFASARGRTIDFTKAPLMNQPVVDKNAQFTLRDLYKKEANKAVMEEFGRLRGIRTFGAPYTIEATRIPRFQTGGPVSSSSTHFGEIETFGPNKTTVSGPTSINYDDRLGRVPVGGFVLNQSASMDPGNSGITSPEVVASTYNQGGGIRNYNPGGDITAALTPGEIVYGPKIQQDPELYAAVQAANNGMNLGGQILENATRFGYTPWRAMQSLKLINSRYVNARAVQGDASRLGWTKEFRARSIMHDSTILMERGMSRDQALNRAMLDFDEATRFSTYSSGRNVNAINNQKWKEIRFKQFKKLDKQLGGKLAYSGRGAVLPKPKTIQFLLDNADALGGRDHVERILRQLKMLDSNGKPILNSKGFVQGSMVTEHTSPYGEWGYSARGNYGQAMWGETEINSASNWLRTVTTFNKNAPASLRGFSFFPDQLIKTDAGLMSYEKAFQSSFGMSLEELMNFEKRGITALPSRIRKMIQPTTESARALTMGASLNRLRPVYGYAAANRGGFITGFSGGGSIGGGKYNYGNILSLSSVERQLKYLQVANELSQVVAKSPYGKLAVSNYSHQVAPYTGKSYPLAGAGIGGVYKNLDSGKGVYVKPVINPITAESEMLASRMVREVFGYMSPEQKIVTMSNIFDPTGKSKLLGLESAYNPIFAKGGTKFTKDQAIGQLLINSILNNRDLSSSNAFGNIIADTGASGQFLRASGNTQISKDIPSAFSVARQLLGGERLRGTNYDFARNSSSTIGTMTKREYVKAIMNFVRDHEPKMKQFYKSLSPKEKAMFSPIMKRFSDIKNADWGSVYDLHINPNVPKRHIGGSVKRYNAGGRIRRFGSGGDIPPELRGIVPQDYIKELAKQLRSGNPGTRASANKAIQQMMYQLSLNEKQQVAAAEEFKVKNAGGRNPIETPEGKQLRRFFGYTYHDLLAARGRRVSQPFAPIQVAEAGYSGYSERGGVVRGNAALPVFKDFKVPFQNINSMLGGPIDKLRQALERPLTAIRNAIVFQNKKLIENKPVLLGSTSKELVHVPGLGKTYNMLQADEINMRGHKFNLAATQQALRTATNPFGVLDPSLSKYRGGATALGIATGELSPNATISANFKRSLLGRMLGASNIDRESVRQAGRIASDWKMIDQERGIYQRKGPGMLGLRRKQYYQYLPGMEGQAPEESRMLTSAQLRELGIQRGAFQMGHGTQMGLMMGSQALGMYAMNQDPKNKILGMSPQTAGMLAMTVGGTLPFMMNPMMKGIKNMKTSLSLGKGALGFAESPLFSMINAAKFLPFVGAIAAATTALVVMKKVLNNWHQDAVNRFGLTAKAAEELGIQHIDLAKKMKALNAAADASKASKSVGSVGVPGLMMSTTEMANLKDTAAGQFKEIIETINRADGSNIVQLMNNIKAQMIGAGKSAEETNRSILGMLMASNNADKAFKVFSDSGFRSVTDRASAAKQLFKQLRDEIDKPGDQFGDKMKEGFTYLLENANNAVAALVGTKDAEGKVIDESKALSTVMGDMAKMPGFDKVIGTKAFSVLPDELKQILNSTDSIGGSLAKWQLYLKGTNFDLKSMSSQTAMMLNQWNAAFDTSVRNLEKAGGTGSTFATIGNVLNKLQAIQDQVSLKAQRASQISQRNAQAELDLINKKIKAIEDEAAAKIKALQATQDKENYQLELQKLQLDYQDALARGDSAAAARAQISIQQLSKDRQTKLAEQAIQDKAEADKAALSAKAEAIQNNQNVQSQKAQDAQYNAATAAETAKVIQGYATRYQDLLREKSTISASDYESSKTNENAIRQLIAEIQKEGSKKGDTAKQIRDSFAWAFENGKAKNFAPTASANLPLHVQDLYTMSGGASLAAQVSKDLAAVNAQADVIIKGLGGGATLAAVVAAIKGDKTTLTPKITGVGVVQIMQGNKVTGAYTSQDLAKKGGKFGDLVSDTNGNVYKIGATTNGKTNLIPQFNGGGNVSRAGGGRFAKGYKYNINDGGKIEGIRFDKGGTIYPNALTMPKYETGGPITSIRQSYGNPAPNNALYNINVTLNGANMSADDVAQAIEKQMRLREITVGVSRR